VSGHDRLGPETRRIVKYAIVGVSNTIVALGSYAILLELGVQYVIAGAVSWTLGLLNGYVWNRIWTFDRAEHRMSFLLRYSTVGVLALTLNTGLLALLISVVGVDQLPAEFVALPIVILASFLGNRYWAFRSHIEEGAV
jgi:putative flippase GtrA